MSQYLRTAPVNMSRILSVSSHYSSLCWWKRAVSEDFCSSDSFRGSHLLCWGRQWFRPSIATSGGKPDKKWPIIYTVVALISKADVITTKSNLSLLDLSLSACPQGWVVGLENQSLRYIVSHWDDIRYIANITTYEKPQTSQNYFQCRCISWHICKVDYKPHNSILAPWISSKERDA